MNLSVPDAGNLEGVGVTITLPNSQYFTLINRAMLVRIPSQSYWFTSSERYHDHPDLDCPRTFQQHSALEEAIHGTGATPARRFTYHLYVFREGTQLENHVFSGNPTIVEVHVNDMQAEMNNGGEVLEVMGAPVYWDIAVGVGQALAVKKPNRKLFGGARKGGRKKA